jgi:glycosyltransferase involved in cell wall biosynthesis
MIVRVAFVLGTSGGGTGRHVRMLTSGLASRGVCVAVFGPAAVERDFGFPSFTPVEIGDRPRAADLATMRRLRGLLRASGFDVVHAHGLRAGALTALALTGPRLRLWPGPGPGPGPRPRLIVTVHNAPVAGGLVGAVYRGLELVVARRADSVLCVSADLEERMRAAGARHVGHAVVSAPVEALVTADARVAADASAEGVCAEDVCAEDVCAETRPLVLAVGRLATQKGFGMLIDAASRWGDAARLMIAGSGPLESDLKARAVALGVDVEFAGPRSDVPALLASAAVFVLPSQWEGQALILMEALRAGVPIVATRVGGNPAVAGEEAALFVDPGDPRALADAVRRVLDDPALAERLRKAALHRARDLPTEEDTVSAALAEYQSR